MPRYTDKQIEKALRECKGMVYVAANRLGCSPNTIKARLESTPKLREALEAENGLALDTAELKLFQAIQSGQPWAVQFYLKTQGKERGYTERQEVLMGGELQVKGYVGVSPDDWDDTPDA